MYSCNKCEFTTKYEYSLTRHVENHNVKRKQTGSLENDVPTKRTKVDNAEVGFTCSVCMMNFTRNGNLKRHFLNKH